MKEESLFYRVLDLVRKAHPQGLTSDDVEALLGVGHQAVSPRLVELARSGLIVKTKQRRRTRSGRTATVWMATNQTQRKNPYSEDDFLALLKIVVRLLKSVKGPKKLRYMKEVAEIIENARP